MSVKFLVGCDPELFLKDKKTGAVVSAHDLIPGTKHDPFKVKSGAIQVDGAAAEFNTDPAKNGSEFLTNISTVLKELKDKVGSKYDFVIEPTTTFDPVYFGDLPDTVRELGCNPDFNAYTEEVNPAPDGEATTMRTASGHVHLGWIPGNKLVNPQDPVHFADCCALTRQMDYYLGLYSLLWDPDNKRRELYGKAGAFRPKPYGVEYRTMSNVWLRSTDIQLWVFNATIQAATDLMGGKNANTEYGSYARDVIDNNEVGWIHTKKGLEVHRYLNLSMPNYKACFAPIKDETKQNEMRKARKKTQAHMTYDPEALDSLAIKNWAKTVNG